MNSLQAAGTGMGRTCIRIASLLFLVFFVEYAAADTGNSTIGDRGIWMKPGEGEESSYNWSAHWIWLTENDDSHTMLARHSFTLEKQPESVILRITASDRYNLYINGQFICRGPARSAPHHQSYDILDITDLLHPGNNSFAVRVHQQQDKRSHQYQGRGGLLVQAEILESNNDRTIISGKDWKVTSDPSWDDSAPRISRFQDIVNDRVDMRKYISGWADPEFDDSSWPAARPLFRESGWPSTQKNALPQTLTLPWTSLVPRDLPYLKESDVTASRLMGIYYVEDPFSGEGIQDIDHVSLDGDPNPDLVKKFNRSIGRAEPFMVPPGKNGKSPVLIFDLSEVVIGMPVFEIRGDPGVTVDIMCAPYILNQDFTHKIVDTECLDRIILSGRNDRWESTYFKPARYLAIAIRNAEEETGLFHSGMRRIQYPFEKRGSIKTPGNEWVERYWEASEKTLDVCTTDGYTDNYRERRQYAQTGYYAALGNYWTYGDHFLQRRYMLQTAQEQYANGIMPAYAPLAGDGYMIIFDSNCLWIRSLKNYLLYSGDYNTVKELLPAATKLMDLFHSCTDENGMINNPPFAYWLDHAVLDRRGVNTNLNGHYLGALEDFAQVLEWLGEDDNEVYLDRAEKLRNSMRKLLWDEKRKLFSDALVNGELSSLFSEHSNAMALALNVADDRQAAAIAEQLLVGDWHNYIKRESGITLVTPAMSYFLHKGLCEYGYVEESFRLFRERFDKMLEPETNQTLWEEWFVDGTGRSGKFQKKTRSDAQTESAFPPALFAEFLFGIKPLRPGMKEISLKRTDSGIGQLEGRFPTPEGQLKVRWDISDGSGMLNISVPGDMKISLDLASLKENMSGIITINGKEIPEGGFAGQPYSLSGGDHEILF